MIELRSVGVGTTLQDLGRPGWAHLGVGRSGAADRRSHRLANRLVGNPDDAATLETSGGLTLVARTAVMLAVAGARCAITVIGGPPMGWCAPTIVPAGAVVSFAGARGGVRCYVGVRGGFDAPAVLGSRSRDTLGGIGPELVARSLLAVGPDPGTPVVADVAPRPDPATTIVIHPGPRRDWFAPEAWRLLTTEPFGVAGTSDRVGVRLLGAPLLRVVHHQLPPEGIVEGALQVPPDGLPIVMLADHPVTGGYPVIAVVDPVCLPDVAQAAPGTILRFRAAGAVTPLPVAT